MAILPREGNFVPAIGGVSTIDSDEVIAPAVNPLTRAWQVEGNNVPGLNIPTYDYVARTLTNPTTETYVFKLGGSGGTTVATVVIVYTTSALSVISTVTKT